MAANARRIGMLVLSTVLRWPLWGVLAIARFFVPWQNLFVVYPGDESDIEAYAPDCFFWMRETWLFRGKPQFAGFQLRRGKDSFFGIVVYLSSTVDEMREDRPLMLDILKRLEFLSRLLRVQVVALAGQLPSIIRSHKLAITVPFIDGRMGSAFAVVETVGRVFEKHQLNKKESMLVTLGVGFLGERVLTTLAALDYQVEAVDIVRTRSGVHIGEAALDKLAKADVIILLTPKGQDFLPYQGHVRPDALIIDDTHPRIRSRDISQPVYKVALAWPGFEFVPRLPGYKKEWIPGCLLEAIVVTRSGDSLTSYQRFHEIVRETGITVPLNS